MTFGERLREARLNKGLTQEQLAQQIGVAKSTLTGYEKGNREPDVFKIKRLLEVLGVDSDYLLGVLREPEQKITTLDESKGDSLLNADKKKIVDLVDKKKSSSMDKLSRDLESVLVQLGVIKEGEDLTKEQFDAISDYIKANASMLKIFVQNNKK